MQAGRQSLCLAASLSEYKSGGIRAASSCTLWGFDSRLEGERTTK